MSILYVLYCDGLQARVYRTSCSPAQLPTELTLGYQQVNFGGLMSEFVTSLCRTIRSDFRAGKFDGLVIIAPGAIWDEFDKHLDEDCHARVVAMIIRDAGPPPDKKDLLVQLRETMGSGISGAELQIAPSTIRP